MPSLVVGEVVQTRWDSRPFRVLVQDDVEVFYDCWWPELGRWGLEGRKAKTVYYRMPTVHFLDSLRRLRVEAFSEKELALHRPDLPMRIYRDRRFSWSATAFPTLEGFADALVTAGIIVSSLPPLRVSSVVLLPLSPKKAQMRGVLLNAKSPDGLSALEVLWAAHKAQAPYTEGLPAGIGLYRSGIDQRGKPSYFIGGYHDLCGATEMAEGQALS